MPLIVTILGRALLCPSRPPPWSLPELMSTVQRLGTLVCAAVAWLSCLMGRVRTRESAGEGRASSAGVAAPLEGSGTYFYLGG